MKELCSAPKKGIFEHQKLLNFETETAWAWTKLWELFSAEFNCWPSAKWSYYEAIVQESKLIFLWPLFISTVNNENLIPIYAAAFQNSLFLQCGKKKMGAMNKCAHKLLLLCFLSKIFPIRKLQLNIKQISNRHKMFCKVIEISGLQSCCLLPPYKTQLWLHITAVPSVVITVITKMYIAYTVNTSMHIPLIVYTHGSAALRYRVELL